MTPEPRATELRPFVRAAVTVFAVAAALVAVAAGPAAAAPEPTLADAQDPAVTTLARDRGISVVEAQRRIGWQLEAAPLADELRAKLGEDFGGLWIDRQSGRVKVGIVAAASGRASTAARQFADGRRLSAVTDLVTVQHGYAQLERDSAWLGEVIAAANRGGGAPLGSGLRVDQNRLVLRLPPGATLNAMQRTAVDTVTSRLGSRVVVEHKSGGVERQVCGWSAGDFDCDAPLRGGVRLYQGSTAWCSTAFNTRSNSDGLWYVMTAGHCGVAGTQFRAFQPSTGSFHTVGNVHNSSTAGNNDFAIVRINNVSGWDPRNWVYVHASGDTSLDPDYTITGTASSPVGTRVCISGSTSGTDCGDVVELNWDGANGLSRAEYCSDGGDSGGAIYSGHRARGIHVGVVAGHDGDCFNALFQVVSEAATALNVSVVTS
jgi:streptogrisin C